MEFRMKNYCQVKTNVKYEHINISNSTETKFLELIIDKTLSWNQHVDQITTKLCSTCYALRNLKHIVPQSTLRTICYAYVYIFHFKLQHDFLGEIFIC
jgi:protein-arginine kinase activator protein McsA